MPPTRRQAIPEFPFCRGGHGDSGAADDRVSRVKDDFVASFEPGDHLGKFCVALAQLDAPRRGPAILDEVAQSSPRRNSAPMGTARAFVEQARTGGLDDRDDGLVGQDDVASMQAQTLQLARDRRRHGEDYADPACC